MPILDTPAKTIPPQTLHGVIRGRFSEPETQAIRAHILAHANLRTAVTHHDDGAGHWLWGFSNSYTYTRPASYALLAEYGDVIRPLTAGFGVLPPMDTGMGANIYGIVGGATMDWLTDIGITAFWTELGFRDGQNLADRARATLRPHLMVTWWAGAYVVPTALGPVDGTLNAGADEDLVAAVRNTGLGASETLLLRVTTTDPYVTIVDGLATATSVAARSSATNGEDGLWIRIAADCPHDHVCPLTLEVDQGGVRRFLLVNLTVNAERDRLISMSIIPGYEWDADQASGAVTDPPSGGIQNIHLRHDQDALLSPIAVTPQ